MPTSRTATMRTAAYEKSPRRPSAKNPPMTRNLSASGSRNAPERVAPSRRASQPSSRSVHASTNHRDTVSHVEPRSSMRRSVGTASSRRATVTKFAGVAIADSENLLIRAALCEPGYGSQPFASAPLAFRSLSASRDTSARRRSLAGERAALPPVASRAACAGLRGSKTTSNPWRRGRSRRQW